MTFQSAAGLADIHTAHQSGLEHISYDDHQHNEDEQHIVLDDKTNQEVPDCHHCCHCHGHSTPSIVLALDRIDSVKSSSPVPAYLDKVFPETFETFLRPPIA